MAQRAGARAVPVPNGHDVDAAARGRHAGARARSCSATRTTRPASYLTSAALRALLDALPEHVSLLLDEALADFVRDAESATARDPALLDDHPRLLIFRTFSKVYGLAGLRAGYALGGPGSEDAARRASPPELGIGLPAQIGALEALRSCDGQLAQRRAAVAVERERLLDALHDLPVDARPSEANFAVAAPDGLTGGELAVRLQRSGVLVQSGTGVGDEHHVRVTLQSAAATDRLLDAMRTALGAGCSERTRTRPTTGAAACRSSARGSCASGPSARARSRSA